MRVIGVLLLTLTAATCVGQPSAAQDEANRSAVSEAARRIMEVLRAKVDGSAAGVRLMDLRRIYEQNGWTTEPDQFSLELALELDGLPPWQWDQRIELLTRRLSDRYLLNEQQETKLRELIERESGALLTEHFGRMLPVVTEALDTRLAGQPYTPEQVARWTELTTPVFEDGRRRLLAAASEFMQVLAPEQRELLETDLDATTRRIARIRELRESWRRGAWAPADWGLDTDPIQLGEAVPSRDVQVLEGHTGSRVSAGNGSVGGPQGPEQAGVPPGGGAPATGQPPAGTDVDNDPWAAYVWDFIRRYGLDEAQQRRAWLTYRQARQRREFLSERWEQRIAQTRRAASASPADESLKARLADLEKSRADTIRMLFEELKRRLDRLPTRAQRRAAESQASVPAPVPTELSGP